MKTLVRSALLAIPCFAQATLLAQQVPNRATLNQILGTVRVHETFDAYRPVFPGAASIGGVLDHLTVVNSGPLAQGPGLVEPGASYNNPQGNLFLLPAGSSGLASPALSVDWLNGFGPIEINYALPVPATGFDVFYAQQLFGGFSATVHFKDTNGAVVGTVTATATVPQQRTFVGWQHSAGIASVEIISAVNVHPAVIDDHTFGLDNSQVSTVTPFGEGCYQTFASFYEDATAFDLSMTSLHFAVAGPNYVVTPGTSPLVPPTAQPLPPLPTGSATTPVNLGWTFPYPGGSTTTLHLSRYGFLTLQAPNAGYTNLLNAGPVIAARWRWYSSLVGDVVFETDPVAQTATVTYSGMDETSGGGVVNAFQYFFDAQGNVEVRYGSCQTTDAVTGWSPANAGLDPGSIDISATPVITPADMDRRPLRLTHTGQPAIGGTTTLIIRDYSTSSLAVAHVLGFVEYHPGIELSAYGMPNCFAHISHDITYLSQLTSPTSNRRTIAIPNQTALLGVPLGAQGLAVDPVTALNPIGATASNALRLVIGLF